MPMAERTERAVKDKRVMVKVKTGGSATAGDPGRGKNSTQLCFAFISGNCDKGDACKFVHVSDAQRSGLARALSNSPGAQNRSESNGRDLSLIHI